MARNEVYGDVTRDAWDIYRDEVLKGFLPGWADYLPDSALDSYYDLQVGTFKKLFGIGDSGPDAINEAQSLLQRQLQAEQMDAQERYALAKTLSGHLINTLQVYSEEPLMDPFAALGAIGASFNPVTQQVVAPPPPPPEDPFAALGAIGASIDPESGQLITAEGEIIPLDAPAEEDPFAALGAIGASIDPTTGELIEPVDIIAYSQELAAQEVQTAENELQTVLDVVIPELLKDPANLAPYMPDLAVIALAQPDKLFVHFPGRAAVVENYTPGSLNQARALYKQAAALGPAAATLAADTTWQQYREFLRKAAPEIFKLQEVEKRTQFPWFTQPPSEYYQKLVTEWKRIMAFMQEVERPFRDLIDNGVIEAAIDSANQYNRLLVEWQQQLQGLDPRRVASEAIAAHRNR